mgnify:CR=1 FL=1
MEPFEKCGHVIPLLGQNILTCLQPFLFRGRTTFVRQVSAGSTSKPRPRGPP